MVFMRLWFDISISRPQKSLVTNRIPLKMASGYSPPPKFFEAMVPSVSYKIPELDLNSVWNLDFPSNKIASQFPV
jgi:hypothetical protein